MHARNSFLEGKRRRRKTDLEGLPAIKCEVKKEWEKEQHGRQEHARRMQRNESKVPSSRRIRSSTTGVDVTKTFHRTIP